MKNKLSIAVLAILVGCAPTQSSQELNNQARISDRFGPPQTYSTPPSEMLDVEQRRNQAADELEREEKMRRRRQDLDRHY